MAITYLAATSGAVRPGPLILNTPTGATEGTVLIATISSTAGVVPPDGWTTIATDGPWSSRFLATWYYVCGASIPADHTFTAGGTPSLAGGILAFDDVDNASPYEVYGEVSDGGVSSTTVVLPSITNTEDGSYLVGSAGGADAATSWTTGVMDERVDVISPGTSRTSCAMGSEPWPIPGATGTRTFTAAASTRYSGILIALRPAIVCLPVLPPPLFVPFKQRLRTLAADITDAAIEVAIESQFSNWKDIERWANNFMGSADTPDRCRLNVPFKDHSRLEQELSAAQSFENWKALERWALLVFDGTCACNCEEFSPLPDRCRLFVPHKDCLTGVDLTDPDQLDRVATLEADNFKALERWALAYSRGDCNCQVTVL